MKETSEMISFFKKKKRKMTPQEPASVPSTAVKAQKFRTEGKTLVHPWVGPGKPNLPLGLRGKAGGGARVTAGPKRPHLSDNYNMTN